MSQHLNAVLDQTRRAEHKRLQAQQDKSLNRTRYLWLRNPATLDEREQAQLAALCERELQTVAVWRLKEDFRDFFACRTVQEATAFFQSWQRSASGACPLAFALVGRQNRGGGILRDYLAYSGAQDIEKNQLKPHLKQTWCIGRLNAEFLARIEQIMWLYAQPYDPLYPAVLR